MGPQDSLFFQTRYLDLRSGDNFQYADPRQADPDFKFQEYQQPTAVAGWHHQWAPGIHTLLLAGRITDEQRISDLSLARPIVTRNALGQITALANASFDLKYHSDFEAYTGELNQIFQTDRQTLILGTRVQEGSFTTSDSLLSSLSNPALPTTQRTVRPDFERISGYGYYTIEPLDHLYLTAGLSYDTLVAPENIRQAPVTDQTNARAEANPKAALVWSPSPEVTLRGAYARSLGGVSYDESFRLEPTQLAGFNQSFRSIISESVAGPVLGPLYQTGGAALDLKFKSHTYAGVDLQWLQSDVHRQRGAFELDPSSPVALVSSLDQRLNYDERSAGIWLNQLVSDEWIFGVRYQFTRSDLGTTLPQVPVSVFGGADSTRRADLHHVTVHGRYQHPSGFFAYAEWDW